MENPEMKDLTWEIPILQETWKVPGADKAKYGQIIFHAFLEKYPQHKATFPKLRDIDTGALIGNPVFKAHAIKIMEVFQNAVDALDKPNGMAEVGKQIAGLADFHIKRSITNKQPFIEIRGVITDSLVSVCGLDAKSTEAWSNFLDCFYHVMFECFDGNSGKFQ